MVRGDLVLRDGVLRDGCLAVAEGRIAGIFAPGTVVRAREVVDAAGCLVFPGAIDAHVHARSTAAEGFTNLTRSAAAGGVTTVIDMPYDQPDSVNTAEKFKAKIEAVEREAVVDVALYGTIRKTGGTGEIAAMVAMGACGFKLSLYETDPVRFPRIPDPELLEALPMIRDHGLVAGFHAENGEIIDALSASFRARGEEHPTLHCSSRPPVSETQAIAKALEFGYWTGCPIHIFHVSLPEGFELIDWYRRRGVAATGETCTHYLLLAEEDMERLGSRGKINPPLRPRAVQERLWKMLSDGVIDLVTSDHAPWPWELKNRPNIFDNASGAPGVELLLPLLYSEGVARGRLSPVRLAQVLAENPARVFRLSHRKGRLAVGLDADLAILDPRSTWTVDPAEQHTSARWSPYEGLRVQGKVVKTIVRGKVVFDGAEVVGTPGSGAYIPAQV